VSRRGWVIYEWQDSDGYLLSAVLPDAVRIRAEIGEDAAAVRRRLPSSLGCFAFHIDLTDSSCIPFGRPILNEYLRTSGVTILNAHLVNISKSHIQLCCKRRKLPTTMARRFDDSDEVLIIKTNRNHGGRQEFLLTEEEKSILGIRASPKPAVENPLSYKLSARGTIPENCWMDADLAVERYINNGSNIIFRAYICLTRLIVEAAIIYAPIKRLFVGAPRQLLYFSHWLPADQSSSEKPLNVRVPSLIVPTIRSFCAEIGMDFGTLDLAMDDDGNCFVIDANATPHWGGLGSDEMLSFLKAGLPSCL
jgi:hypothetical protein